MSFLWFLSDLRFPAADIFFQGVTYLAQEVLVIAYLLVLLVRQ